ncbi:hypothetical protein H6P81_013368 [Aristolochia fimbriata]|uniref:Uncharacterized protein n=1 Tax=Aristolochia fimbriata TaxID=158543 RepID=A0AAV7EEH7_ARIFI|nr:hypothetical protein H6P81_013368 [Aristolochia fimbriata]
MGKGRGERGRGGKGRGGKGRMGKGRGRGKGGEGEGKGESGGRGEPGDAYSKSGGKGRAREYVMNVNEDPYEMTFELSVNVIRSYYGIVSPWKCIIPGMYYSRCDIRDVFREVSAWFVGLWYSRSGDVFMMMMPSMDPWGGGNATRMMNLNPEQPEVTTGGTLWMGQEGGPAGEGKRTP